MEKIKMRRKQNLVCVFSFAVLCIIFLSLNEASIGAHAALSPRIQLCMVIDGSGTISDSDWTIIVNAFGKIVNLTIPHDGTVEFSLIQFGNDSNVLARTELPPTSIDSTTYATVSSLIQKIPKMGGSTSIADGIYLAWRELTASSNYKNAAKHVIILVTDGIPNIRNGNATRDLDGDGQVTAYDDVIAVVNNSIDQGLSEIDMELIGVSEASLWFKANVVYPKPGTMAPPFTNKGWVRQVTCIEEFADTLPESLQATLFPEEIYTPQPENALIAAATTMGTATVVATMASAVTDPKNFPLERFASRLSDLLPTGIKKSLNNYIISKHKLYLPSKKTNLLKITRNEIVTYSVTLLILTSAYAYVKVSTLNEILLVIPTILLTSILVEFVKNYVVTLIARYKGIWMEHSLWYLGAVLFMISSFGFRVPFSSPNRLLRSKDSTATKKILGLIAAVKVLIQLTLAGVFTLVFLSRLTLLGNIGIVMCVTGSLVDSIPIFPLNGKDIYGWDKKVTVGLMMFALAFYLLMILIL